MGTVQRDSVAVSSGVPIAVRDFGGSGTGLVLIHGLGTTLVDWTVMAPMLTQDHHVVALDLRGHGRSGDGAWSWSGAVDDLGAVIDHFEMSDPAVMGHSLGGMIAAMWGRQHPGCQGVVNLDGHGLPRLDQYVGLDPVWARERRAQQESAVWQELAALGGPLASEQVEALRQEQRNLGAPEAVVLEGVQRMLEARDGQVYFRPAPDGLLAEIFESIGRVDMLAVHRELSCPLLLLNVAERVAPEAAEPWEDELMVAFRQGQTRDLAELASGRPSVRFETVAGTHSGLLLERPQLIADLVNAFFREAGSK